MEALFSDIDTEHKAFKFLTEKGALIRPISKVIDKRMRPVVEKKNQKISLSPVQVKIQTVPMDLVLKKFLELTNVFNTVIESLNTPSATDQITSVVQCEYWQKIKSQNPGKITIPLSIYFDDFDINNPLGAHKKKIGGVFLRSVACLPNFEVK